MPPPRSENPSPAVAIGPHSLPPAPGRGGMGSKRPRGPGGSSSSSAATENAGAATLSHAVRALAARSSPRFRLGGEPGEPGPRRSGRSAAAPTQERGSTGPVNVKRPSSDRHQNGGAKKTQRHKLLSEIQTASQQNREARLGASNVGASISSPRDSDRQQNREARLGASNVGASISSPRDSDRQQNREARLGASNAGASVSLPGDSDIQQNREARIGASNVAASISLPRDSDRQQNGEARPGASNAGASISLPRDSDRQQNREARLGGSNVGASVSLSRDSDRQQNGSASSSSKKRKRITARSYFQRFRMARAANAADVVIASPDIVGKENTSISLSRDSDRQQNGIASSSSKKQKRITARSYFQRFRMARAANAADVVIASPDIVGKENTSISLSRDSDRQQNGSASSSSKKQKRITARSYFQRFRMARAANAADVVIASPDIVGKENTSSGHVEDSNIDTLCEAMRYLEKPMFSVVCTTSSPPPQQLNDTQQKEGVEKLMNTPANLHVQLKQELSKLIEVLQLPDNVRLMADQLFEYVLNNHQVVTEPVVILHAFNIALCWRAASLLNCKVDRRESLALAEKSLNCECNEDLVALMYRKLRTLKEKIPHRAGEKRQPVSVEDIRLPWQETSTNLENDHMFQNKEMDLHGKFINGVSQEISTVAEQMISERQEPVQETHRDCDMQSDELPSMIVEKSINLISNVFSLREKNILCKQQLEISGLVTHRQKNVIRLKEVCTLVLEHIRRSHIDEMTRREKIKLTAQWFTMLMYAFLEHMKLQREKLEGLQSDTWSSELQLMENLHRVAESGQLDQDFGQRIALPDSNFVMEEFTHFKEHNDEYRIVESSLSHCQQSSNATLLMEITLVQNEVLSEPISIQAMENEPVETSVGSHGGLASEAVDFPANIISCSSDGIGVQSSGCSSSTVPSDDDSIGQEASTSECRNTEHIKIDSIAKPSMVLGGATSLVRGVNSNNDDTIDTDRNHLESPILASSQSFISLVGAQSVLPCMSPHQSTDLSAQQNVAPSQCLPVEPEHTCLLDLGTQVVQDLQPEMQPSIFFSDAPLQKMPDESCQTRVQPDRATRLPQGAAETSLHSGDARTQGQGKGDGNVAVDPVLSESPTYPADSPVTLQVSTEVETQTCESSMPAKQSTSPPAQQSILGTEAASDLQPEVPSTSMQDEPIEADDEPETVDEPDAVDGPAEAERAATLGAIAAQDLHSEMQSSTSTQDVSFEQTYISGMSVLHSPTIHRSVEPSLDPHAGAEPVGMVTAHDFQSEILPPDPVPAKQNTSLLVQQSLATSQHSTAEAKRTDILGTERACNLQPSLGEVHDQPAEEQSCILGAIAARNMQPETQPSTSTQSAPFERTHLFVMPVLQSPMVHHSVETSLDPHARAESTHTLGSLTAHVLQPEAQPSAPMQDRPGEAEGTVMLGSMAAQDLQAELESSAAVQHVPLERICPEERRQIDFQRNMVPGLEQPTQHPPVTMLVNNPILSDNLLKNELHTIMHCKSLLSKDHEHKKALLLTECNQEIEKIKKMYASLLEKEDYTYLQAERDLTDIYRKVVVQTSLAENFRREMTPSAAAQGRSTSHVMEQPSVSSSAAEPSSIWNAQPQPNLSGTTSSPPVPAPAPRGSYRPVRSTHLPPHGSDGSAGAQLHPSARLLQQLRMPRPYAVHTDQQQLPAASPGVASSSDSTSGPPTAAPGSQIAGGYKSASLNALLPAKIGLGSSAVATGSRAEVVCLSDDES